MYEGKGYESGLGRENKFAGYKVRSSKCTSCIITVLFALEEVPQTRTGFQTTNSGGFPSITIIMWYKGYGDNHELWVVDLRSMTGKCTMKNTRYTRSRLRWKIEVAIVEMLRACRMTLLVIVRLARC